MINPKTIGIVCVLLIGMSLSCACQYLRVAQPSINIEELIPSSKYSQSLTEPNLHLADRLPHLGFMCILENRQDKIKDKKFTYRMRLGNLDYVNRLEGK